MATQFTETLKQLCDEYIATKPKIFKNTAKKIRFLIAEKLNQVRTEEIYEYLEEDETKSILGFYSCKLQNELSAQQ